MPPLKPYCAGRRRSQKWNVASVPRGARRKSLPIPNGAGESGAFAFQPQRLRDRQIGSKYQQNSTTDCTDATDKKRNNFLLILSVAQ